MTSSEPGRIYVLSANSRLAEDYIKAGLDKGLWTLDTRPEVLWNKERLYGLRDAEVHLVGPYAGHMRWHEFEHVLQQRALFCNVTVKIVEDWR